jgi:septal ring factor EnvC (AmiA/AmiB activator)
VTPARKHLHRALAGMLSVMVATSAGAYVPGSRTTDATSDASGDFEGMVAALESREKKLEREIDELGPHIDTVSKRTVARGRAYYRMVRAGLLPVAGGFDSLVDHAATVERLRAALSRDVELKRALQSRRATAIEQLKRLRTEKAPLLVQREAMHRAKAALQQADERHAAFSRAFGGSQPLPHLTVYGTGSSSQAAGALEPFSRMRGRLSLPLEGRAEVLTPPTPMRGAEGLTLVAARDAAVRSVYAGRVTFVGETKHGVTVVIDHGERYFSVYARLSRAEVQNGEDVGERSRIGWIVRDSAQSPSLYFELRRGRKLLDAAPWLGL